MLGKNFIEMGLGYCLSLLRYPYPAAVRNVMLTNGLGSRS